MVTSSNLMETNEDDRIAALKIYNRTPHAIKEDIKIIREWFERQPHFPKISLSDKKIERFLISSKLSIELTKKKLDMYFSIRQIMPEVFSNTEPSDPEMVKIAKMYYYIPLPKMIKDGLTRVHLFHSSHDLAKYDFYKITAHINNTIEVFLEKEYSLSQILVFNMSNISFACLKKLTPLMLKQLVVSAEKIYGNRIKSIHLINISPFLDNFVTLLKNLMKPKLASRIQIDRGYESLHKFIPKEVLPVDYGGYEKSMDELRDLWFVELQKHSDAIKAINELKVNESLRPGEPLVDIFGTYGNFRQLDFD